MSEAADSVMSTIEGLAKRVEGILLRSKDSPQLLGIELVGLGSMLKVMNIDFMVWDFSGKHVPAPNLPAQNTQDPSGKPPPTPPGTPPAKTPTFYEEFMQNLPGMEQFLFGSLTGNLNLQNQGIQSAPLLENVVTSVGNAATSAIPNILGLLGINLPTQIMLSEVIILAGILLLAEPLLKAVEGSLSGLFSTATSALKLG